MKDLCLGIIVFLILVFPFPLRAELETTLEIETIISLTRDSAGQPLLNFLAQANLGFASVGNENVKAGLEFQGLWSSELLTLPHDLLKRIFIKVNLEGLYLTFGKTHLSFGEGFVFNAGDVIFGLTLPLTDLSAKVMRDETQWLLALNIPLGDFSFLEIVFLPFSPLKNNSSLAVDLNYTRLGGRASFEIEDLKLETGYFLKADEGLHNPYLSLAFNLFFDVYLAMSLKIPWSDPSDIKWEEDLILTGGFFKIFNLAEDSRLALRFEYLFLPLANWQDFSSSPLIFFIEGNYQPIIDLTFSLRSFFSPPDLSGIVFIGVDFAIYQGFSFSIAAWCMFGPSDAPYFGFGRMGDIGLNLVLHYIY